MRGKFGSVVLAVALASAAAAAQQRPRPPATPQSASPSRYGSAPPPSAIHLNATQAGTSAYPGVVQGYIYWAASDFQYNDSTVCQALTVAIKTIPGSSIVAADHHPTHIGAGPYVGCAYAVHGVPEGPHLELHMALQPGTLNPPTYGEEWPAADPPGPLTIPGGACYKAAPPYPSPSDLNSAYWICGDYVYNFNLQLYVPGKTGSLGTHPLAQAPTGALHAPAPGPVRNLGTAAAARPPGPMLGAPGQPLLANGNKPGTLMAQKPGITNGTMADGSRTAISGHGATATPSGVTVQNGGSTAGPTPGPSKGQSRNKFDAVTLERGVTQDPGFSKWANPAPAPRGRSQARRAGAHTIVTPAKGTRMVAASAQKRTSALTPALVGAACTKDARLRILGVAGSAPPITFRPRQEYVIWGCSFGPANPNNAVYLSDGSSFTWYLAKVSWGANAVVVQVSTAPSRARSNLMLFVLGQNGNTKLDGVALSTQ